MGKPSVNTNVFKGTTGNDTLSVIVRSNEAWTVVSRLGFDTFDLSGAAGFGESAARQSDCWR